MTFEVEVSRAATGEEVRDALRRHLGGAGAGAGCGGADVRQADGPWMPGEALRNTSFNLEHVDADPSKVSLL